MRQSSSEWPCTAANRYWGECSRPQIQPLAHVGQRQVQAAADQRHHLVDLRARDDQRRRDDHAVADGAHDQAVAEAVAAADHADFELAGKACAPCALSLTSCSAPIRPQVCASPTSGCSASCCEGLCKIRADVVAHALDQAQFARSAGCWPAPPRRPPGGRSRCSRG